MREWSADFERECVELVDKVVSAESPDHQVRAWQSLLGAVAPHVELWAQRSWMLKRYRLESEDDARTVLLGVLERMQAKEFANLRAFRASTATERPATPAKPDPGPHAEDAERLVWAAKFDELERDEDPGDPLPEAEAAPQPNKATPLRGWLITLVRFCVSDHVRRRVGWAVSKPGAPSSKRELGTDAERLTDLPPSGVRPPVTDYVRLRRFIAEVEEFAATFPDNMRDALRAWLVGHSFKDMAAQGIADTPHAAQNLVKAAKTRLRERFRG